MENKEQIKENDVMKVIVNTITSCRLLGATALPFIYHNCGADVAAICTLGLYATDAIDGFLARKCDASTFLGSLLDVCGDKLLNTISFILLALNYPVMWAPLILELTIMLTNYVIYKKGGSVIVSKVGRAKMIILAICTILSYIFVALPAFGVEALANITPLIINILGGIVASGSLLTLIDYLKKLKSIKSNKSSN